MNKFLDEKQKFRPNFDWKNWDFEFGFYKGDFFLQKIESIFLLKQNFDRFSFKIKIW